MGLREKLNENPAITTGATIVIIVIAVGFIIYSALPSSGRKIPKQAFFSVDDGATWFVDDVKKTAPFDKDGKPAMLAHVFKCGDKEFVAYMERFNPAAKAQLEALGPPPSPPSMEYSQKRSMLMQSGLEYKKPKGDKWYRMNDYGAYQQIMNVVCPDKSQMPEPVIP